MQSRFRPTASAKKKRGDAAAAAKAAEAEVLEKKQMKAKKKLDRNSDGQEEWDLQEDHISSR